ncbi:hypothetical protein DFH06DRAFT_1122489 [Mycena polygramma]|nr:hypothetical protein DFH06DRAFT_1122489 [Mycena polygramma]
MQVFNLHSIPLLTLFKGRALVLYVPVWKGQVADEIPPLISEAAFQRGLILHYDEPFRWQLPALRVERPLALRVQKPPVRVSSAGEIEHLNWVNGWGWAENSPGASRVRRLLSAEEKGSVASDLQRGEKPQFLDWFLPSTVVTAFVPGFGLMSYESACLVGCRCSCHRQVEVQKPETVRAKLKIGDVALAEEKVMGLLCLRAAAPRRYRTAREGSCQNATTQFEDRWRARKYYIDLILKASGAVKNCIRTRRLGEKPAWKPARRRTSLSEIDGEETEDEMAADVPSDLELTDSEEEIDQLDDDMDTSSGPTINVLSGWQTTSDAAEASDDSAASEECIGHCEHCTLELGAGASVPSRVFKCADCDALQCESCCHTIHVCKLDHKLSEWQSSRGQWIRTTLQASNLCLKYPTLCGVCDRVLAEEGGRLLRSALWCEYCEYGVMCQRCCFEKHAKAPLHRVKTWKNGRSWKATSLREAGFVYQMGHAGESCPHPDRHISSLLVIAYEGLHRIHLRYCRCPDSEGMARANWEQIRGNGWFPSSIVHPGICSTFPAA